MAATTVAGTANDPAFDDVPAGPAATPLEAMLSRLDEIQANCNEMVLMHRTVADGVRLAANQVRDKRLEWCEAGAEATLSEALAEMLIVAALSITASAVLPVLLTAAFRFARSGSKALVIASRSRTLARLAQAQAAAARAATRVRSELVVAERELATSRQLLAQRRLLVPQVDVSPVEREVRERARRVEFLRNGTLLQANKEAAKLLLEQFPIRAEPDTFTKKVEEYLAQKRAKLLETTLPITIATGVKPKVAGQVEGDRRERKAFQTRKGALDSPSVQFESQATAFLRSMEHYFECVKDNARLLVHLGLADPRRAPACQAMLDDMAQVVAPQAQDLGEQLSTAADLDDFRNLVALDAERNIWALLMGQNYQLTEVAQDNVFKRVFFEGLLPSSWDRPPARVFEYFRLRFFEEGTTDVQIMDALVKLRDRFKKVNQAGLAGREPIATGGLVFQKP